MPSFSAIIERLDSTVYGHYVKVPDEIVKYYKDKKVKRLIATFNETAKNPCAILSSGKGFHFINANKDICKKLRLDIGSKVEVILEEDTSKYGMPVPEEMEELMKHDPEGTAYFEKLSPGKIRSLLWMIGKPKNTDTRLKKAVVILDYLKASHGELDYKALNEAFKNANNF